MEKTASKVKISNSSADRTKLDETLSVCPLCSKVIKAKLIEERGKVFLEKEHCGTKLKVLQENGAEYYKKTRLGFKYDDLFSGLREGMSYKEAQLEMVKHTSWAYLPVTEDCNMDCPICWQRHRKEHLPFSSIKKVIRKLPAEAYCLSGGEPTMYPKLFKTIKYLRKMGKYTAIVTNGLKLMDRDYVEGLKKAGLDTVTLGFEGFDDKIYKRLRGRPLSNEKMKILRNLKEVNIPTTLYCIVTKESKEDQIPSVIKYAKENKDFISQIWFGPFNKKGDTEVTSSDIWETVGEKLGIQLEYLIEERKFRHLVYKLAGKFFGEEGYRKSSVINHPSIYLSVEDGELNPLFKLEELRRINKVLQASLDHGKIISIIHLFKNIKSFLGEGPRKLLSSLLKSLPSPARGSRYLNRGEIIRLRIGRRLEEPYTTDLRRLGPHIGFRLDNLDNCPYESVFPS